MESISDCQVTMESPLNNGSKLLKGEKLEHGGKGAQGERVPRKFPSLRKKKRARVGGLGGANSVAGGPV